MLNNSDVEMDTSVSVTSDTEISSVQKSLDNSKQCTLVVLIVMHKFGVTMLFSLC